MISINATLKGNNMELIAILIFATIIGGELKHEMKNYANQHKIEKAVDNGRENGTANK